MAELNLVEIQRRLLAEQKQRESQAAIAHPMLSQGQQYDAQRRADLGAADRAAQLADRQARWTEGQPTGPSESFPRASRQGPVPTYVPVGSEEEYFTREAPEAYPAWQALDPGGGVECDPGGQMLVEGPAVMLGPSAARGTAEAVAAAGRGAATAGRNIAKQSLAQTQRGLPRMGTPLATARHEATMGRAQFPQLETGFRPGAYHPAEAGPQMESRLAESLGATQRPPARVPQGGLETRGARSVGPDPAWRNRANWEHSAREARLSETLDYAEEADALGLIGRGQAPKSAWRAAQMATARQFSHPPLPRPAPGTRITSPGPGGRPRTPAEPERELGKTLGEMGRTPGELERFVDSEVARQQAFDRANPAMTEAARRGASESAANVTKPWTEYPGKLTGTNVEQDVLDIMMTPRHKGGEAWTYSPYRISQLIEGNTGVKGGEGRIRATLKDLEVRGLVEPGGTGRELSAMDAKIRSTIANPDLPLTGARYKKSLPDWANPAAGRERVHLGTYRLRQGPGARDDLPEYFGSE